MFLIICNDYILCRHIMSFPTGLSLEKGFLLGENEFS